MYWENEHFRLQLTSLTLLEGNLKKQLSSAANIQSYPSTQISVLCFIPIKICSNSSQWDFCHSKHATQRYAGWAKDNACKLLSPISFCRPSPKRKVQFPQAAVQAYKQIMPELLQSHPSVCGFCIMYAVFHLFKFRPEEFARVHDVNVRSISSNYM